MSVYKKLSEARVRLQSIEVKKSKQNKFAGYSYMELGDFLPGINSIFNDLGLCGIVSFTSDMATLTIVDVDDNSSVVITSPMGSAALKGCHEVQNIGAVETYQRRYLWLAAMEIVEHDAIDYSSIDDDKKETSAADVNILALTRCETMEELISVYSGFTPADKRKYVVVKDDMKRKLSNPNYQTEAA